MQILSEVYDDKDPPFASHQELYNIIDSTKVGEVEWQSFAVSYTGEIPPDAPAWMKAEYEVWFRNPEKVVSHQLANPSFAQEMDLAPKRVYSKKGKREYKDFMSGNWAWRQAVRITSDSV